MCLLIVSHGEDQVALLVDAVLVLQNFAPTNWPKYKNLNRFIAPTLAGPFTIRVIRGLIFKPMRLIEADGFSSITA